MALRGTDPESYVTEYTLAYENKMLQTVPFSQEGHSGRSAQASANKAHIRQSRPEFGLGFQVKVPETF